MSITDTRHHADHSDAENTGNTETIDPTSNNKTSGGASEPRGTAGAHKAALLIGLMLLLIAAAAVFAGVLILRSHGDSRLAPTAFVIGACLAIASVMLPALVIRESSLEAEAKQDCERDCATLKEALQGIDDRTLRGLALVNFQQLRVFTVIAQRQARMSYYASLIAAAVALLMLTSGAAIVLGLPGTTAKVAAGTLTGAGAALSGFLTKTFLATYQMASRQMSYYYGQPLVHCYLLHAEWLTNEAHAWEDKGVDRHLLEKVIDASIQASFNAQNHLVKLQNSARAPRGPAAAKPSGNGTVATSGHGKA